jgi:hypothetical protein
VWNAPDADERHFGEIEHDGRTHPRLQHQVERLQRAINRTFE